MLINTEMKSVNFSLKTLVIVESENQRLSQRFCRIWRSIITAIIYFNKNISIILI